MNPVKIESATNTQKLLSECFHVPTSLMCTNLPPSWFAWFAGGADGACELLLTGGADGAGICELLLTGGADGAGICVLLFIGGAEGAGIW